MAKKHGFAQWAHEVVRLEAKATGIKHSPSGKMKAMLRHFWAKVSMNGPELAYKSFISRLPGDETLEVLRDFGQIKFKYRRTAPLSEHRAKFDKWKHVRMKNVHKRICFACRKPAEIRHHIISLKNGGRNTKLNVVYICRTCHSKIHPWLVCKMA